MVGIGSFPSVGVWARVVSVDVASSKARGNRLVVIGLFFEFIEYI
jgi:hypothetical protein